MKTPIFDYVKKYNESDFLRAHMPGHKGHGDLGIEQLDITEIRGADSLYEAEGIIKESEDNASFLFGCDTYYSTEGSSLAIRAMLHLAVKSAATQEKKPLVLAARNVHKVFLSAAAFLDFDVEWLYGGDSYLSFELDPICLEEALKEHSPAVFYLTSPDYLGRVQDIEKIAKLCHKYGTLLAVDNAHGAYLKFLSKSQHPIDLGADFCCDSAHKTLPVLTGGAYLHIASELQIPKADVKNALALFGSTSPSYLILQSLDLANRYMANGYKERLNTFCESMAVLKKKLLNKGYFLFENEPLKLTISAKSYGYTGEELAEILFACKIVCEFCDRDFLVLMLTPKSDLAKIESSLLSVKKRERISSLPPKRIKGKAAMSVRKAMLSQSELLPRENCLGRILASPSVSCPPAVPILVCGEIIDSKAIEIFDYYNIENLAVVKQ